LLAASLVGQRLTDRFQLAFTDKLGGRTEIYQNARQMAADFPWFGTGPGTFPSVYYLYRQDPEQTWAAFLHDDWMETRVTFGRIGFALVLLQFALFFLWTWSMRERWLSPMLSFCCYLSLAGCLIHAKADFPFQTYGVTFTFVAVCALLTVATRPGGRPQESLAPA
jgi:O-antigen ligase